MAESSELSRLLSQYLPTDVTYGPTTQHLLLCPDRLLSESYEKKYDVLDRARRAVTAAMTEASKKPLAAQAMSSLRDAQVLINAVYNTPEIQASAQEVTTTSMRHEYIMIAEMARDVARFYWKVAEFSGQTVAYEIALQWLHRAHDLTQQHELVRALIAIEQVYTAQRAGRVVDQVHLHALKAQIEALMPIGQTYETNLDRALDATELLLYIGLKSFDSRTIGTAVKALTSLTAHKHGKYSVPVELPILLGKLTAKNMFKKIQAVFRPVTPILLKVRPQPSEFGTVRSNQE